MCPIPLLNSWIIKLFDENVFFVPFMSAFNCFLVSLYNCLSLSLLEWFAINLWLSFSCCKAWMFKSAIHDAGGQVRFIRLSGACWFVQVRVNSFSMYWLFNWIIKCIYNIHRNLWKIFLIFWQVEAFFTTNIFITLFEFLSWSPISSAKTTFW